MATKLRTSLERTDVHRYPIWVMIVIPILAISLQTRLALYSVTSNLDLALLVTLYFASNRRNQIVGITLGAAIGLTQDCLSHGFIGIYGIVKTLIGYLGSSLGARVDVDNLITRLGLIFAAYYLHWGLYYVVERGLLDHSVTPLTWWSLLFAVVNALIGVVIFHLLDRLRIHD